MSASRAGASSAFGVGRAILALVWIIRLAVVAAVLSVVSAGCSPSSGNPKVPAGAKSSGGKHATIETDKGSIEIELLETSAPRAVENFRLLAEHGY